MLKRLSIKNFAIIDQLEIEFDQGFNILTGETGAGKSIILGALGLLLGQRADGKALKNAEKKCIIEGHFDLSNYDLSEFFNTNDLDQDQNTILRREITTDQKSRGFINDTPVTIQLLRQLGESLVDIHSQHETLELNSSAYQLGLVDSVSDNTILLKKYSTLFNQYQKSSSDLTSLIEQQKQALSEQDYIRFQFDELFNSKFITNEQTELETEQIVLTHAEEIQLKLSAADRIVQGDEGSVLDQLKSLSQTLQGLEKISPAIESLSQRIKSLQIEAKDISGELENIAAETHVNPDKLQIIQERLDLIYRLQQKHRVNSIEELLIIQNDLDKKLLSFEDQESQIENLQKEISLLEEQLLKMALELSTKRKKSFSIVIKHLTENLQALGIPNAVFEIDHQINENKLSKTGFDDIKFLFSANKGQAPVPLHKVASGGELSRLMLCIKSLLAQKEKLPTIIFDEIDTGVSGEVAIKMGLIMKSLSKHLQVISITHLPQIASQGEQHYYVYKDHSNKETSTFIKKLNTDERVLEIAKMLSGDQPSAGAMENARELLKHN